MTSERPGRRAAPPYGVLLMTYGSAMGPDDVRAYLTRVRGGREPSEELVAEFARRYRVIGGSPLIGITRAQAAAVEERLGGAARVRAGMRFSEPSIAAALRELAAEGCETVVAIVLSPQYSPLLMSGYATALEAARAESPESRPAVRIVGAWHMEPTFVDALAGRVREALGRLGADGAQPPVLMTAHSLPRRVAEREPEYLDQLTATAQAVAERAGLAPGQWRFCWQSAGHEPGEWMKPDFADLMPQLRDDGHRSVLVVPVQFLADHLEVLYDIDVGAREQAEAVGMRMERIRMLNCDPLLIETFARLAERTVAAAG